MMVSITSNSTKEEIDAALRKLGIDPTAELADDESSFDAFKFYGTLKLTEDAFILQKQWREEWD